MTDEAIRIERQNREDPLSDLNQKSEWGQPRVPRLGVTTPAGKPATEPSLCPPDSLDQESLRILRHHQLKGSKQIRYQEPEEEDNVSAISAINSENQPITENGKYDYETDQLDSDIATETQTETRMGTEPVGKGR